ncbi:hypothetical protein JXJ21_12335 [candidate division KSB1 bacterium]|nr:hypothetical protein [candidate division KSB1 bacterium]
MGKALLIIALGFSAIFSTMALNMSKFSLRSVESTADHLTYATARNCATSGVYMALSRLAIDQTWRAGFQSKDLSSGTFSVNLQDCNDDPSLSSMELRIISDATSENVTKSITVVLGLPPDIADLAVFCTDTIRNVTIKDESGNPDPSLAVMNAPDMLPFDKDGLVSLAISQGHVQIGDYSPPDNYPNGNFYFDVVNKIPNVTHVTGDCTFAGGRTVYGIYVVEGNAVMNGSARLYGVIYIPNPGSIVIHGGGVPSESSIYGGIFANGYVDGTGNHISVRYDSDYMATFGQFQTAKNLYIVSWTETPNS